MTTDKLLSDLVQIASFQGKGNTAFEKRVNTYLKCYFQSNFPNFKLYENRFSSGRTNLVYLGSSAPQAILVCHTDTVPPANITQLKLQVRGDKAFGLGTKDMKGGIVSSLLCLNAISDKNKVGLIFYGDEELTQKGMLALTNYMPKVLTAKPALILSPESQFNLGYGARGIIVIQISLQGIRAHSARPHLGVDAIKGLYKIVERLEKEYHRDTQLGHTTFTITHVKGGSKTKSGEIQDSHGSIPDFCLATISVRNSIAGLTAEEIINQIKSLSQELRLKLISPVVVIDHPARFTPAKIVKFITRAAKKTGVEISLGDPGLAGYNDAALLGQALSTPVVNFGPYGEANHSENEWVSLSSIELTAKVISSVINEL